MGGVSGARGVAAHAFLYVVHALTRNLVWGLVGELESMGHGKTTSILSALHTRPGGAQAALGLPKLWWEVYGMGLRVGQERGLFVVWKARNKRVDHAGLVTTVRGLS